MEKEEHPIDSELLAEPTVEPAMSPDAAPEVVTPDELTQLSKERAQWQTKAEDNWDKVLRTTSDLENVRKRAERDVANAHRYGQERLIKALLPVLDGLENALLHDNDAKETHEGVSLTLKMLLDVLQQFEVLEINPINTAFDPNFHEAIAQLPDDKFDAGQVISVYQKGYKLHDRVIRAAKVVVAK